MFRSAAVDATYIQNDDVLEGYLYKKRPGAVSIWQKRYFLLERSTATLSYYKTQTARANPSQVLGMFTLANAITQRHPGKDFRFDITLPDPRTYELKAVDQKSTDLWVKSLQAVHSVIKKLKQKGHQRGRTMHFVDKVKEEKKKHNPKITDKVLRKKEAQAALADHFKRRVAESTCFNFSSNKLLVGQLGYLLVDCSFDKDTVLFHEGQPWTDVLIISSGALELSKAGKVFSIYKPGDIFTPGSEINGRQLFSARALEKTDGFLLDRAGQQHLLDEYPGPELRFMLGQGYPEELLELPLFANNQPSFLPSVRGLLHVRHVQSGEFLYNEGSQDRSLFILLSGEIVMCKAGQVTEAKVPSAIPSPRSSKGSSPSHSPVSHSRAPNDEANLLVLTSVGPGAVVGELSLLCGIPRLTSAYAMTSTLLIELRGQNYYALLSLLDDELRKNSDAWMKQQMMQNLVQTLRSFKLPFFDAIPPMLYEVFAEICELVEFQAGQKVIRQGEPGDSFYIILHGELDVLIEKDVEGKKMQVCVKHLGKGSYFGEVALVMDTPRTATIVTSTRAVVLLICRTDFEAFFKHMPEAVADFELKQARCDCALRTVLFHNDGINALQQFLASEYSSENLNFWQACRTYLHLSAHRHAQLRKGKYGIAGHKKAILEALALARREEEDDDDDDEKDELADKKQKTESSSEQTEIKDEKQNKIKKKKAAYLEAVASSSGQEVAESDEDLLLDFMGELELEDPTLLIGRVLSSRNRSKRLSVIRKGSVLVSTVAETNKLVLMEESDVIGSDDSDTDSDEDDPMTSFATHVGLKTLQAFRAERGDNLDVAPVRSSLSEGENRSSYSNSASKFRDKILQKSRDLSTDLKEGNLRTVLLMSGKRHQSTIELKLDEEPDQQTLWGCFNREVPNTANHNFVQWLSVLSQATVVRMQEALTALFFIFTAGGTHITLSGLAGLLELFGLMASLSPVVIPFSHETVSQVFGLNLNETRLDLRSFLLLFPKLIERSKSAQPEPLVTPGPQHPKTHPALCILAFDALNTGVHEWRNAWDEVNNCDADVLDLDELRALSSELIKRDHRSAARGLRSHIRSNLIDVREGGLDWPTVLKVCVRSTRKRIHARVTVFEEAVRMFLLFVDAEAPHMVNIAAEVKNHLVEQVATGLVDSELYSMAEAAIFTLMSTDSFPRFKVSPFFEDFVENIKSYDQNVVAKVRKSEFLEINTNKQHMIYD